MKRKNFDMRKAILDYLEREGWVTCAEIAQYLGTSIERPRYYLTEMVKNGLAEQRKETVKHIDSNASSARFIYKAASRKEETFIPPTPAPYRNLRFTENLTDYDRTNHRFSVLCMLVRK